MLVIFYVLEAKIEIFSLEKNILFSVPLLNVTLAGLTCILSITDLAGQAMNETQHKTGSHLQPRLDYLMREPAVREKERERDRQTDRKLNEIWNS